MNDSAITGLKASYLLQTAGGQVQLVDTDAAGDGNDGTDTFVGIETIQFKDQSMGIVSPIILDLDSDGVQTVSAADSNARFDMNGDGNRDDTSWISNGDGFLFLDRDENGTLSGIAEMSFTIDVAGAATDLKGLAAFDSNGDEKISAADQRFDQFMVWHDANGNGNVDAGEILSLADIGLAEISLAAAATKLAVGVDGVAVVNNGEWISVDGRSMGLADAVMTFTPGVGHGKGGAPVI